MVSHCYYLISTSERQMRWRGDFRDGTAKGEPLLESRYTFVLNPAVIEPLEERYHKAKY